jgi:lipopolysaccharide heptosyltransferase II
MSEKSKRILIFNVNWLGDVLFSTAVIRNIRYNYPDSFIGCIVPERCLPVLEGNPHLNEIIVFDENREHKAVLAKIRFIASLRKKNFDTAFLLHRSFTRALITRLSGIKEAIGYLTNKRGLLLTKKIIAPDYTLLHRIDYYLNIIEKAGLSVRDKFTEFFINEKDLEFIDEFLKQASICATDFVVGINPGGNWDLKRWDKEYFCALTQKLINDFKAKVIITGSAKDLALAKEIAKACQTKPVIACGQLTLKQFGALCKRLDLFITADTGPLHIANALGTKRIIALFGPTDPKITGPYPGDNVVILQKDLGCKIPCYKLDCKDNRCMKAISVEDVIEAIKKIV